MLRLGQKQRSWPRNGEASRGASFAYHSARMQLPQSNVGGHTSPRQPISTLRSDLYKQSNSDQRNGSGCSKDDICPSYSMQPKEQESRDFISSPEKSHGSDDQDHNFLKEKVTYACDDNLTQELGVCSSYSDTWGEKTAEPATEDYDHDTNLESFIPRLDLETLGNDAFNYGTVDRLDVQTCNQSLQTFGSGAIHLKDFENETDHFMDAPNVIESESGTDMNCMRKQDVDHFSKLEGKAAADGLPENIKQNLNSQASISESNIAADSSLVKADCGHKPVVVFPESCSRGCYSSGRVPAKDEDNSVSSADKSLLTAQMTGDSLYTNSKKSISGNGGITHSTNKESISCRVSSNFRNNGSGMPTIGDTKSSHEPEKHVPETSDATSVTFWTNGGLLGLQPSKPSLCSVLNDLPQYCLSKEDWKSSSSTQHVIFRDRDTQKPDETNSFLNIEEGLDMDYSTSQETQKSDESLREKFWKRGNLLHPHDANSTGASVSASGSFLSVNSDFQAARNHREIAGSSSRKFELSSKLLSTLSYEKQLHGGEENFSCASYLNTNAFEQKKHQNLAYQTLPGRTEYLSEGGSLMQSPPSSPPLAHMKISVQPMDGFKNSKLKLKFMDGDIIDRGSIDIFPSFQLVPEVSSNRLKVGSNSDDDTFCRSSPSVSDDFHDHHSESNSEQWESGRPPDSEDPDLYDSLWRISLAESVSTVQEIHENCGLQFSSVENSMQSSRSFRPFDLRSLGIQNQSFEKKLRKDTNSKELLEPEFATADPPPLPPVQWWAMKPHLDANENSCVAMPKALKSAIDLKHSASSSSQQYKPISINHDQNLETANEQKSKPFSSDKSNAQRETSQGKNIEENNFLNQIRRKSLSLRPTVPAKPIVPSRSSTNVHVMTILEKVNAIRQAVGSDDGDNLSDT